ncbi:MAG: anthranilate phosphoribosyltransferase [Flavobacteriaceae bacterium]|nr:anthranilate phosphoribosyltransferase [Flavobacteriaceae bacterium]
MKQILETLFEQKYLSKTQAKEILINIANNKYNEIQIASFMTVFLMRPIQVEELMGFREALLELAIKIDLSDYNTIDMCGTGGDGKNTFNISTLSSFVVAGTGNKVSKHGNYGVSSTCGSSNVLEYLGYEFTNNEDILKKQLDKANICFLHAPLFHPALKNVGSIRRNLGVKTFFNILGPLVNPSNPTNQLVGVFNMKVARAYKYLFENINHNYAIVHSLDGYDEVSLTSDFKFIKPVTEQLVSPEDTGMVRLKQEDIFGGDSVKSSAEIFKKILDGKGTEAQNSVVFVNSALALQVIDSTLRLEDAIGLAKDSLLSGKAKQSLKVLIETK